MNPMGQMFAKQAEDMFQAAEQVRVPESVQAIAEESVQRARAAYSTMTAAATDANRAFGEVAQVAGNGARVIGEQVLANVSANTEAAFKAAEVMARSKSLPELAKHQAAFVQAQMMTAGEQTREFYELSSRVARETFEALSSVAQKGAGQARKAR
jgi:hypothetical protein